VAEQLGHRPLDGDRVRVRSGGKEILQARVVKGKTWTLFWGKNVACFVQGVFSW